MFILQFAEGVILNLESMSEESDSHVPMICFLSMGSDPTENIMKLAKKKNISKETFFILAKFFTLVFYLFQTSLTEHSQLR